MIGTTVTAVTVAAMLTGNIALRHGGICIENAYVKGVAVDALVDGVHIYGIQYRLQA